MDLGKILLGITIGWLCGCTSFNADNGRPSLANDVRSAFAGEGKYACLCRLDVDDPFGKEATMHYVPSGPVCELDWVDGPFSGLEKISSEKLIDPIAQQLHSTLMILDKRRSAVAIVFVYKSGFVRIDRVGARDEAGRIVAGKLGNSQWFGPAGHR